MYNMLRHYKITLLSPLFCYNKTEGGVASTEPFIGDIALDYALNFVLAKKREYTYQIKDKPNYEEIKEFGFVWTIGRPIYYEKTPIFINTSSFICDGVYGFRTYVRLKGPQKGNQPLYKDYRLVQGIKEGSVFEASLLTFEDIKLPKTFTLRIGVGRECLLLFEEKKEKPEEIWLNLYTIKKIFGKDVKLRESQMLRFVLSHYIIGTGFKVEDLEKIFSN